MRFLVLSVDRDNDFGEKAGIVGPIVGRDAHVAAATKLALADPEDSDVNSAFGAVQALDELRAEGHDAEVVTLTGDRLVGPIADRKLTAALEAILTRFKPQRVVFVTDGAEDETILPVVTSRVRVEAVRRVIVKQNAGLEGTYYVIKKALEDDKMQRTFLMPLGLGLLVYGLFAVIGNPVLGLGAIALTLGIYFLGKVLHLGEAARRSVNDVVAGFTSGKVSLFTSLLAILVVIAGGLTAARNVFDIRDAALGVVAVAAANSMIWWVVAAALIAAAGKVTDAFVRDGEVLYAYWTLPFSLVAAGLILTAALRVADNLVQDRPFTVGVGEIALVIVGFLFALTGSVTNAYVRQRAERAVVQDGLLPDAPDASEPGNDQAARGEHGGG